jgi:uncharacterized SAM-binding protein YcdF (DUF218 family)
LEPPRKSRWLRRIAQAVLVFIAAAAVAFLAGFVAFASFLPSKEVDIPRHADGIVALTGGAFRIHEAIELLAAGHGRRLLITGVNPTTSPEGLAGNVPAYKRMFECCIDIDHSAMNTVGNAIAARRWSKGHSFGSLIVVTSNYHLPRAMAELSHQLPEARLIPFPVVTDRLRQESWWSNPALARLIATEYVKYIYALFRNSLDLTSTAELDQERRRAA